MHLQDPVEYTFQLRRDVAADWSSINPILRAGEPGVEIDTGKMKIGDGLLAWTALPYYVNQPFIEALIEDALEEAVLEGVPGDSAYDVAVDNGFVGTESEWLDSLVGPQGIQGIQGIQGNQGIQGIQGIQGTAGTNGTNGTNGTDGEDGANGLSAFQVALANGFVGTEAEWLASLEGDPGESVTVTLVDFEDWPPASDSNPLHLYFRLPEA